MKITTIITIIIIIITTITVNISCQYQNYFIIDTDVGSDDVAAITLLINSGLSNNTKTTNQYANITSLTTIFGAFTVANATKTAISLYSSLIPTVSSEIPSVGETKVYGGAKEYYEGGNYFPFMNTPLPFVLSPPHFKPQLQTAWKYFESFTANSSNRLTFLCLGPLTNLAKVILSKGNLFTQIVERIIIMGGAVEVAGNVPSSNFTAEFNIWGDPAAAHVVFHSNISIVLIPMDVTQYARCSFDDIFRIAFPPSSFPSSLLLQQSSLSICEYWADAYFYDPVAAAYLLDESIFEIKRMNISVQVGGLNSGQTYVDNVNGSPIDVAVNMNSDLFFDLLAYFSHLSP